MQNEKMRIELFNLRGEIRVIETKKRAIERELCKKMKLLNEVYELDEKIRYLFDEIAYKVEDREKILDELKKLEQAKE